MARLFIRVDFDDAQSFGPGKARLLELVDKYGSITRAATSMRLSYTHAWKLIESTQAIFGAPLVTTTMGGVNGGGAELTKFGRMVVARYRELERRAMDATADALRELSELATAGKGQSRPDANQPVKTAEQIVDS